LRLDLRWPWKLSRGLESFFLLGRLTLYALFGAAPVKTLSSIFYGRAHFFGVLDDIRRTYIAAQAGSF
jgi:hypothetical protein